ncbi:hypothetical protein BDV18DRAFT_88543 [Aspergillus unguis]
MGIDTPRRYDLIFLFSNFESRRLPTNRITRNHGNRIGIFELYSQPDRVRWPCTPSELELPSGNYVALSTLYLITYYLPIHLDYCR